LDHVSLAENNLTHLNAVDVRAVGGAQIAQDNLASKQDLSVMTRDTRIVDPNIDISASAKPGDGSSQRVRRVVGD
jgi:hypothetical protein